MKWCVPVACLDSSTRTDFYEIRILEYVDHLLCPNHVLDDDLERVDLDCVFDGNSDFCIGEMN
jgi:hypothetical protein